MFVNSLCKYFIDFIRLSLYYIRIHGGVGMIDSIGFDLDGTLWSSMNCITEAWQVVAEKYTVPTPSDEQMRSVMGLNKVELMNKLFPDMGRAASARFFDEATVECVKRLRTSGGILYDGVEETLAELSKHFKLYVVSNCQESYMDAFLSYHKLGKYFCETAFEEPSTLSKGENIKKVIAKHGFKHSVYVGDTQGDKNAAEIAGISFGYAAYGFGNVDKYDYKFDTFRDILLLINK